MIWKGHISFGLVNMPVALYPAEERKELDFTLLDEKDLSPIGYRKVNKATGEEVPRERITRGFEYEEGHHVIVTDDDLRRASPERTQRIDILHFTDAGDIDPKYYDRPYYLEPTAKNEKGYVVRRAPREYTLNLSKASRIQGESKGQDLHRLPAQFPDRHGRRRLLHASRMGRARPRPGLRPLHRGKRAAPAGGTQEGSVGRLSEFSPVYSGREPETGKDRAEERRR